MPYAPLISAQMFDDLRNQGIEPYIKLDGYVREPLGDAVRGVALFAGASHATRKLVQRVTVLSGTARLDPAGTIPTLDSRRDRCGRAEVQARRHEGRHVLMGRRVGHLNRRGIPA